MRPAFVASLCLALSFGAPRAEAYCRSTTCGKHGEGVGSSCEDGTCSGAPLAWTQPCLSFDVTADTSPFPWEVADAALTRAFASWTTVDCGAGRNPSIQVFDLGSVPCAATEYNQHAGNANILAFREVWPHPITAAGDTLALTTVTFDPLTGAIYDADIEVNSPLMLMQGADLEGVLAHEAGHFLGLAHSDAAGPLPTMNSPYHVGQGILAQDDMSAICAVYPPNREVTTACTAIPRHGWAPECGAQQTYVGCAAASATPRAGIGWVELALLVTAWASIVHLRASRRRACGRMLGGTCPSRAGLFSSIDDAPSDLG